MKRFSSLLLIAATFCGAASIGHAQGPGGGPRLDADGDGKVSAAEFAASGMQRFQRMDENGDGLIDKAEATAIRKRTADRMMNAGVPPSVMAARPDPIVEMDADKDGQVTKEEAAALQEARFKAADKNGDGALDADEQAALRPGGARPRG
jgi:Ca2+-binding EF-hand superfamily protein